MTRYWYDFFLNGMGPVVPVMLGLLCLLLLGLITVIIVATVRTSQKRQGMPPGGFYPGAGQGGFPGGALQIAAERYAKGEITEEEYLKMKENLSKQP